MFKFRQNAVSKALLLIAGLFVGTVGFFPGATAVKADGHGVDVAEVSHQSVLRLGYGSKSGNNPRHVKIGLSKSMIVELPGEASDILVSNPKIIDAVMHTSRRVYLIGKEVGQANVFFFGKNGKRMAILEMKVERDLAGLSNSIKRLVPGSDIQLETVGDNIVMTGSVRNPVDASRAADLAKRLFKGNDKSKVLNMVTVKAKEQVMLKVVVAEMNRKLAKQLGVNAQGVINTNGNFNFSALTNPSQILDAATVGTANWATGGGSITKAIRALEENGLVRTLAEPNMTALSGETAKFHAGGEFGYVVTQNDNGIITYTVKYKDFGVQMNFTPVVLSEGRISLKVKAEVSEIDGFVLGIPTLAKRETETTIELPSGGSMAIGGMISEKVKQNVDGLPGLMKLPVLGQLFRSQKFQKEETELVVIITPYLVNPVARKKLVRPDKGYSPASDDKMTFLGRINRVYGRREEALRGPRPRHQVRDLGFIVE